jgi:inner membrane protein
MEPITHTLTAVALSHAGLNKATRLATPMLLAASLAPELDALGAFAGAPAYFAANRAATHSVPVALALAAAVAVAFWFVGRKHATAPVRFLRALAVCAAGAMAHLLLDCTTSYGVQLLWPFGRKWVAWGLADEVDPWILIALVAGLLLPGLFRMVTEEIGARPAGRGRQRGAIIVLSLMVLYLGGRVVLHAQAAGILASRMYHGASPRASGAFPAGVTPLVWRGIVATENTFEEVEVPLGPGTFFDPDRGCTHFKPEPSPVFDAAQATETVKRFAQFARFPSARVERLMDGYRVTVRDLRFPDERPAERKFGRSVMAVVELNNAAQVTDERLQFVGEELAASRR